MKTMFMTGACSALLAVSCLSQQVWKVNSQGGPGSHFTDLPQAVAAASPGDEIWVYNDVLGPGASYYTAPVIDKPLRIKGFTVTPSGSGPTHANIYGPLVILDIPNGQRVEISGLSIVALSLALPAGIVVLDCQGDILLEDVYLDNDGSPTTFARFERCANVVLRGCALRLGGYPVTVVDSQVLLTTTAIHHTPPIVWGPPLAYAATTEGIRVINSTVTSVGSVIWGAHRVQTPWGTGNYGSQPAVVVESGVFRVGPATYLLGGLNPPWSPAPAHGYHVINPTVGSIRQDARGTIVNPPPTPSVFYEYIAATFHSWVVANESFGVTVIGPPSGFALMLLGDWQPNTPTPLGMLDIDPTTAFLVDVVPLSTSSSSAALGGVYAWTLNCPITAPIAKAFAFQALTLAPNGTLGLTIASPLTVGWPHGVTP